MLKELPVVLLEWRIRSVPSSPSSSSFSTGRSSSKFNDEPLSRVSGERPRQPDFILLPAEVVTPSPVLSQWLPLPAASKQVLSSTGFESPRHPLPLRSETDSERRQETTSLLPTTSTTTSVSGIWSPEAETEKELSELESRVGG